MKRIFIITILFISFSGLSAQNTKNYEIGYFIDINDQLIQNYYDVDYQPKESLNFSHIIGNKFTPGYYYNLKFKKYKGDIKKTANNKHFLFKDQNSSSAVKIYPNECLGFVTGIDSFAVIQVKSPTSPSYQKEFAEVINKFGHLTFYKHIRKYGGTSTSYFYKVDSINFYYSFPTVKNEFIKKTSSFFGDFYLLKKDLINKKYKLNDFPKIAKLYEYKYKLDNGQKLYFSKSWNETSEFDNYAYTADILSLKDSIWEIKYFHKTGKTIYKGSYSSFYPNNMNGEFIWYYPNGNIRKKAFFKNNKLEGYCTIFHTNGNIQYKYKIIKDKPLFYVFDDKGNSILDNMSNAKEMFYDSIMKREIIREFKTYALASSYYITPEGKTIYQKTDTNAKLKRIKSLQTNLNFGFEYPIESITNNTHGTSLVRLIIEPTGYASKIEIIKGIDPYCNSEIKSLLNRMKSEKLWKPAIKDDIEVAQEIILPVNFLIHGGIKYSYNNLWNVQMMMMNDQMMMLQQMRNNMNMQMNMKY